MQLAAAAGTILEIPAANDALLSISIVNDTTTSCYFTLYKVPDGGTAGADNLLVNQRYIASRGIDRVPELQGNVFGPGETLQGLAETAAQLTLTGGYLLTNRETAA